MLLTFLIISGMKITSFSMIPVPPDIVFDGGSDFDGPEAFQDQARTNEKAKLILTAPLERSAKIHKY